MAVHTGFLSRPVVRVILTGIFLACLMTGAFYIYYRNLNKAEDPRINGAKLLLKEYDEKSESAGGFEQFYLLDSAQHILDKAGYGHSFETGVIFNNKCTAFLYKALYDSAITSAEKANLLRLAMLWADSSIYIYKTWLHQWQNLDADQIENLVVEEFDPMDRAFINFNYEKLVKKRVKEIVLAQTETKRRLSVSFTNKGTIYRHLIQTDSAYEYYKRALDLWNDNRTAKSNLSVLLGGEPVKPGVLESLFPPDRKN